MTDRPAPEDPEPFLSLSQAMRLHTRHALPAIDDLLDALKHAASGQPVPEAKRAVLARTERGIRSVCRPATPEIEPGGPCRWCPADIGELAELELGHGKAAHHTYAALLKAGFTDPAQVAATRTADLAAIPRVGPHGLRVIRAKAPYAGDEDR